MIEMMKAQVASVNAPDAPIGMSVAGPVRPLSLGTAVPAGTARSAGAKAVITAHASTALVDRGRLGGEWARMWKQTWAFGGGMAGRTVTTLDDDGYSTTGLRHRRPPN